MAVTPLRHWPAGASAVHGRAGSAGRASLRIDGGGEVARGMGGARAEIEQVAAAHPDQPSVHAAGVPAKAGTESTCASLRWCERSAISTTASGAAATIASSLDGL